MGLTLSELDELDEGTVMDMIIESGNDLCDDECRQVATQQDIELCSEKRNEHKISRTTDLTHLIREILLIPFLISFSIFSIHISRLRCLSEDSI